MCRIGATSLVLLLSGCAALGGPPVVENRFRSLAETPDAPAGTPAVSISVSTAAVPDEASGILLNQLGDRAQSALISETKGKPPLRLKASDKPAGAVRIANTLSRRAVVAVRPADFLPPGDRVDAIRVSLAVAPGSPGGWRITSWTQASNGQTVIDIGKLTDTEESKLSASSSVKAVDFLPDLKIEGESSRTRAREAAIKDTTDFDATVDPDGTAWLDETAGWRVSLAHNLSMDLTLTAPIGRPDAPLTPQVYVAASPLEVDEGTRKGQLSEASAVRLAEQSVFLAQEGDAEPVCGIATLKYRVRHITNASGRSTFSESDDDIEYQVADVNRGFLLAPPPFQPSYAVEIDGRKVHYRIGPGNPNTLAFQSLDEATAFARWLRQAAPSDGKLGNASLSVPISGEHKVPPRQAWGGAISVVLDDAKFARAASFDPKTCELRQ